MRRLTRGTIREARNILTLTRGRAGGVGGAAVSIPQPTAQNEMIIASATPAWTLLTAPAAEGQVLVTGADPYTPAWGTTFPTVIQFDAGLTFGGATGVNIVTVPDNAAQAMHLVDAGGIEYLRIISTDAQPVVVFNDGGADVDHRWEAVGQANALFIEGSTGWVGILTPSPSVPLEVNGAIWGGYNTDIACYLGRAAAGWCGVNDQAAFAHVDAMSTTGFALKQTATGATVLNAAAGQNLYLTVGSDAIRVTITAAAVVFNDGGADVDHRWEAVGQANALFIQGSDGNIGVRTNAPANLVHVYATTNDSHTVIIDAQGTANDQRATLDLITLGDGETPLGDAATLGWHLTARGNAYATTAQQNDLLMVYWNGTSWQHCQYWNHDGDVLVYENSAWARLSGTFALHFVIPEPIVETVGQIRIPWDCTVTRVDGNVRGGTSCTVNVEEVATIGSSGTDILSSDMVADANGESVTSSFDNSSLAEGNHLAYDVSAVSGAVTEVNITITGTID